MDIFSEKFLKRVAQICLSAAFLAAPFVVATYSLYFPFVSGKVYIFRLFIELAAFFWVLLILRFPNHRPNLKDFFLLAPLAFLAGLTITGILGVEPVVSFFGTLDRADGIIQFAHWVLALVMLVSLFSRKNERNLFFSGFIGAAVVVGLYSWAGALRLVVNGGHAFLTSPFALVKYGYRLTEPFGNPSYVAGFMLFAIGIALITLLQRFPLGIKGLVRWRRAEAFLLIASSVFFFISLISTQTRGAYLGFMAGFLVFSLLIIFSKNSHRQLSIFLVAVMLAGTLLISLIFGFRDSSLVKNTVILSRVGDATRFLAAPSVRERLLAWNIAWLGFRDKPVFGWGPENYGAVFNKYYNFQATRIDSWFDRPHNEPLQMLSEGGIFLAIFYLFWVGSVFYAIRRIFKEKRILGSLFAAVYAAFIVQGMFLFDTLPFYLGLFPFLALIYFEGTRSVSVGRAVGVSGEYAPYVIFLSGLTTVVLVYFLVWQPFRANYLAHEFFSYASAKNYDGAIPQIRDSIAVGSPYLTFEARKQAGWMLIESLEAEDNVDQKEALARMYSFITKELDIALEERPTDQQIYYVGGAAHRLGYERFGRAEDLVRAEEILKLGRERSPDRAEYVDELARVLALEKKYGEAEALIKEHSLRVAVSDETLPHVALGHLYFIEEKYDLAVKEYAAAKSGGHAFWENDVEYARYVEANEKIGDYEAIIEIAKEYLANNGDSAAIFYNIASSYRNLRNPQIALEFFNKAVKLDQRYSEFESFFK